MGVRTHWEVLDFVDYNELSLYKGNHSVGSLQQSENAEASWKAFVVQFSVAHIVKIRCQLGIWLDDTYASSYKQKFVYLELATKQ